MTYLSTIPIIKQHGRLIFLKEISLYTEFMANFGSRVGASHLNFNLSNQWQSCDYFINYLRTDGDFCHQKLPPKYIRLSKPTDMTIHWNALEDHFVTVPLVFLFYHHWGEKSFSDFFSKKNSVL
jgi:hypothetical protein